MTAPAMSPEFASLVSKVTAWLEGRPLTRSLADDLHHAFPPGGEAFEALAACCRRGIAEGWLASRGEEPLRWGRILKAGPETHGFSVDVVRMTDVAGPHHTHPLGEIDMIVPLDPAARFDDRPRGWLVYEPGSSHSPTVTQGSAAILYLLPAGEISFSAS